MTKRWLNVDVPHPPHYGTDPAILLYDIETSPQQGYTWGNYKQNVLRISKPQYILSVAYQWWHPTDPSPVYYHALTDNPRFRPDHPWTKPKPHVDRWVVARLWRLFDLADGTVAHNGDKFDWKKVNGRLSTNGAPPPSPAKQIDTVKEYRRYFGLTSNRLDDIARHFGWGHKAGHSGLDTWFGVMEGDPDSVEEMKAYNIGDVDLLRQAYEHILPWVGMPGKASPGPNWNRWHTGVAACPRCGSERLLIRGYYTASTLRYRRFQCKDCKGYTRERYAIRDHDGGPRLR